MNDLICRKTMMHCQTPGMCSPFGGCSDSSAVNPGSPLPGAILAADHDRIVAERDTLRAEIAIHRKAGGAAMGALAEAEAERDHLAERVESLEATRNVELVATERLAARCRELEEENLRVLEHNEFLAEVPNRMGAALRVIKKALGLPVDASVLEDLTPAINTLRAEVERLKEDQQRRDHENAKLLRDAWGEVDTLRAEVEQARGTAEYWKAGLLDANAEVERLRMQLVACGVVAMANTQESAAEARDMHPDYMSASCQDVMRAVDSEMALRAEVERREKQRIVLCEDKDKLIGMCQERDRQIEGLRAEVERLRRDEPTCDDVEDLLKALSWLGVSVTPSREEAGARWLELVRTLISVAAQSKMLRQDSEKLAEVERLRGALNHAEAWISSAPHGDNCFVSNHYDGDPGSGCNCGKDSVQEAIAAVLEASQ